MTIPKPPFTRSVSAFCLLALPFNALQAADTPHHELPELRIQATSLTEDNADSVADRLSRAPRLALRSQGILHSQKDLRVRGSAFSGTGFTIEGLALRNPQTEHFHAELPLAPGFFEPMTVTTGLEQVVAGEGHLVGTVAAEFATPGDGGSVALELGEGGGGGSLFLEQSVGENWGLQLHAGTLWFPGQDYDQNDVARRSASVHLRRSGAGGDLDLALGYRHSEFGARGFYGVSPAAFPRAYEELQDVLATAAFTEPDRAQGGGLRIAASIKRLRDKYMLDETNPTFYRNEHTSTAAVFTLDRAPNPARRLDTRLRFTVEDEWIDSEGVFLGAPNDGLGNHRRQRAGLTALPRLKRGPWEAHAGGQWVVFSEAKPELLGIAALSRTVRDHHRVQLAVTQTVRQPSYTELNYQSPTSLGNSGLRNQRATETELAWAASWSNEISTTLAAFHRVSHSTVDWVQPSPGARWEATDMGTVLTDGVELGVDWTGSRTRTRLFYSALSKDADRAYHASRYALDYAKHRLSAAVGVQLTPAWELTTTQEWVAYRDNPARTSPDTGWNGRVALRHTPTALPLTLEATVHNLWQSDLQPLPGQRPAGRWFHTTLTHRW